jgi:hypothetical protein
VKPIDIEVGMTLTDLDEGISGRVTYVDPATNRAGEVTSVKVLLHPTGTITFHQPQKEMRSDWEVS